MTKKGICDWISEGSIDKPVTERLLLFLLKRGKRNYTKIQKTALCSLLLL